MTSLEIRSRWSNHVPMTLDKVAGLKRTALFQQLSDETLGSIAALALVFFVARIGLVALLRAQAENTVRAAVFLADVALGPILFLGAALLYFDQEARLSARPRGGRMRRAGARKPRSSVRSVKSGKG